MKVKLREKRILAEAQYIIDNKATLRETAIYFGLSKSTIQRDMKVRLFDIDLQKAKEVEEIRILHTEERYSKGGSSTQKKWLNSIHYKGNKSMTEDDVISYMEEFEVDRETAIREIYELLNG